MPRTLASFSWVLLAFLAAGCGDDASDAGAAGPGGSAGAGSAAGGFSGNSGQSGQAGSGGKAATGGAGGSGQAGAGAAGGASGSGGSGQAGGAAGSGPGGSGGSGQAGSGAAGSGAGGSGGSGQSGSGPAGGSGGSGQSGSGPAGGSGGVGGSGGSGQSGSGGSLGGTFRYGVNAGYYTSKVPDADSAALAVKAGANSMRVKLSEQHLNKWGDSIEVSDMESYEKQGMTELVVFLGGPVAEHSTAPPGKADWELEHYSPKNLYEPIFLPDGEVNPDNYWASFVARVVKVYGKWLKTYEVWNEPDQVGGNWQATLAWDKEPPKPSDLVWWNDSIFAYVRALRITYEVVHKLDPDGQVALGGIGYPSFLDALLRYTDEPGAGTTTADFPQRGGAYFDVLSYHYYPVFAPGNSDLGAEGLLQARGEMAARLAAAQAGEKRWLVTESGAPRYALKGAPGGEAYARNYLLKLMTLGHGAGLMGIDWFALGDGKKVDQSQDPFDYMGLYFNYSDVQSKDEAKITPTGVAYATLGQALRGAQSDPIATQALSLPPTVSGGAFRLPSGKRAFVLWARDGQSEDATASYALASAQPLKSLAWDASATGQSTTLTPQGGVIQVSLGSAPLLLLEE